MVLAWVTPSILAYIERRVGTEFDSDVSRAFMRMMEEWELRHAMAVSLDAEALVPSSAL